MRKLIIVVSSLTLVFILLMSMGMPVMAAKPEQPKDNKPVAWVNFTGSCPGGQNNNPGHYEGEFPFEKYIIANAQISVKQLANGNTVGHCSLRTLRLKEDMPEFWIYKELSFEIVDSWFYTDDDSKVAEILTTIDGYYWLWHIEDNGEPGRGNDAFSLIFNHPVWGWVPYLGWQTIAPDNIQVHITEDY